MIGAPQALKQGFAALDVVHRAPASRFSRSTTSAMVEPPSTARAACGGLGEDRLGAGAERAVEQLDDLEHGDLRGLAGERVAALHAALGAQDAGAAQHGEELLEELDRDVAAARQLADRDRAVAAGAASSARARSAYGDLVVIESMRAAPVDPMASASRSRMRSRFGPPLSLMALIFFLSAQPDLNAGLGDVDTIVRKLVHMAEYGAAVVPVVARARLRAAPASPRRSRCLRGHRRVHQTFVEGRTAAARRADRRGRHRDRVALAPAIGGRRPEPVVLSAEAGDVTVATTPAPRTRTGNAPPWAANSARRAGSSRRTRPLGHAHVVRGVPEPPHDAVLALDPLVVVGGGALQRAVEQPLLAPPDVDRDGRPPRAAATSALPSAHASSLLNDVNCSSSSWAGAPGSRASAI